jgi:hypothetical protein
MLDVTMRYRAPADEVVVIKNATWTRTRDGVFQVMADEGRIHSVPLSNLIEYVEVKSGSSDVVS